MLKLTQAARTLVKKGLSDLSDEMLKRLFHLSVTECISRDITLDHPDLVFIKEEVQNEIEEPPDPYVEHKEVTEVMSLWNNRV